MIYVPTMNAIVKFTSGTARQRFLERARTRWPDLADRTYEAKRRPDAVIEQLSETDMSRLKELVTDLGGEVFEDVQFEPMEAR